jgi:glyoxylase-like metal-dependent hydrolase (beta-lactamase superfamily II)
MLTMSWRTKGANVHVLRGRRDVLVDAGPPGSAALVRRRLGRAGVDHTALAAVLLTHGHLDHAGSAAQVADGRIPVLLGAGDRLLVERPPDVAPHGGQRCRSGRRSTATFVPFRADELVDHVRHLDDVGIEGELVVVGGHTAGSCVVVTPCTLVLGDLLGGGCSCIWTRRRAQPPGVAAELATAQRLLDEHRPRTVLLGHGRALDHTAASRRIDALVRRAAR